MLHLNNSNCVKFWGVQPQLLSCTEVCGVLRVIFLSKFPENIVAQVRHFLVACDLKVFCQEIFVCTLVKLPNLLIVLAVSI